MNERIRLTAITVSLFIILFLILGAARNASALSVIYGGRNTVDLQIGQQDRKQQSRMVQVRNPPLQCQRRQHHQAEQPHQVRQGGHLPGEQLGKTDRKQRPEPDGVRYRFGSVHHRNQQL